DEMDLAFEGEAGVTPAGLSASGEARLQSGDLEPWLAAAGVALPGFGLGLPVTLESRLDLDDGLLVLSGLRGEVAGAAVNGDVNAGLREGLPHLTGALALASLDLAPLAELVTGAAALGPGEDGGWPDAPFAATVAPPVTAELDLAAGRLWLGSFAE